MCNIFKVLHWLLVQARTDYSQLSVTTSSLIHLLCISPTSLCTPLPSSFVQLQTHGYFVSPMLELKPLANALSLTFLLPCSRIMEFCLFSFCPPHPPPIIPLFHSLLHSCCVPKCVCVCVGGGGGGWGGGDVRNKIIIMFMNIFFLRFSIYIFY